MRLPDLYQAVTDRLSSLDSEALWPGFTFAPFCLYDNEQVHTPQGIQPRDDRFYANTAIEIDGTWHAIWNLASGVSDLDRLTASIVHESFHAWQNICQETRWPDEWTAVRSLNYTPEYLQLKLNENRLLKALVEDMSEQRWLAFLTSRKFRRSAFPEAVAYEEAIEWIEGTATAVEDRALAGLGHPRSRLDRIVDLEHLIPIRPHSYEVGAVLFQTFLDNEVPFDTNFGPDRPMIFDQLLADVPDLRNMVCISDEILALIDRTTQDLTARLRTAVTGENRIPPGSQLHRFNMYGPHYLNGWLYSDAFVAILPPGSSEPEFLPGNWILRWDGETIHEGYLSP